MIVVQFLERIQKGFTKSMHAFVVYRRFVVISDPSTLSTIHRSVVSLFGIRMIQPFRRFNGYIFRVNCWFVFVSIRPFQKIETGRDNKAFISIARLERGHKKKRNRFYVPSSLD
jgi:hypothetical protein